jgi:hypothetical protein
MRTIILVSAIVLAIHSAYGTTVTTSKHVCPVCKKEILFREVSSGYNAQFDQRQYLEWTYTQSSSIYFCTNCCFCSLKNDFDHIPANKAEKVKVFLKTLNFAHKYQDYTDIPASAKLEICEKIYKILGRNNEFWCNFYRIMGYHYEKENKPYLARNARFEALVYAHTMLCDGLNKGKEKELLYIIATMNYFTAQKGPALAFLKRAEKWKYTNNQLPKDKSDEIENHLSYLIAEYQNFISEQK